MKGDGPQRVRSRFHWDVLDWPNWPLKIIMIIIKSSGYSNSLWTRPGQKDHFHSAPPIFLFYAKVDSAGRWRGWTSSCQAPGIFFSWKVVSVTDGILLYFFPDTPNTLKHVQLHYQVEKLLFLGLLKHELAWSSASRHSEVEFWSLLSHLATWV